MFSIMVIYQYTKSKYNRVTSLQTRAVIPGITSLYGLRFTVYDFQKYFVLTWKSFGFCYDIDIKYGIFDFGQNKSEISAIYGYIRSEV